MTDTMMLSLPLLVRLIAMGLSQTLTRAAGWTVATLVSDLVNLWETETDCE